MNNAPGSLPKLTAVKLSSTVLTMFRIFSIYFSLFLTVMVIAPSFSFALENTCNNYLLKSCHSDAQASNKTNDDHSKQKSHECALNHLCCHTPAYVGKINLLSKVQSPNARLFTDYFFSASSPFLERPFQPPEA